jgi:hypothetical protein
VKSYLISALAVRFGTLGREVFLKQHAHDWLVWEAGAWKPPANKTVSVSRDSIRAAANRVSESLAVALEPDANGLVLGRDPESDLVINDGTLSGHHLTFRRLPTGVWTIEDANSKNGSVLDGERLASGEPSPLRDGVHIAAAHVSLTFYSAEGIIRRLLPTPAL